MDKPDRLFLFFKFKQKDVRIRMYEEGQDADSLG